MTDIHWHTAAELARAIRAGELSSREVVGAHILRIQEVDPKLNAVIIPLFERAREEAEQADRAREAGAPLGPLHGVPITLKEQFLLAGTKTNFGLPAQADFVATEDGPLVRRLRDAGAIVLGKTNVSQALVFIESDNPVYGRTANPWSLERSCGGSSGGEAAIIAAGGSPLGLGGDLGGSIREPSHFCGIHGFKPTSWRLTNLDTRPGIFPEGQDAIIPQPGPMARSVEDLVLAMEILAAPGASVDPAIPPVPWPDPRRVDLAGLRVALYTDDGYFPASPAIRRAVEEAGEALAGLGVRVERWSPPDVATAVRLFFAIFTADDVKSIRDALGSDAPMPQIAGFLRAVKMPRVLRRMVATVTEAAGQKRLASVLRVIGARDADAYWRLVAERNAYRQRFLDALDAGSFDAIVCPPTSLPAVRHGDTADLVDFDSYARLYNVLGMPAGVVAASRVREGEESDRPPSRDKVDRTAAAVEKGSAGLPVGVQVAARPWRDDVVLAVMAELERHFRARPDHPARPPI